MQLFLVIMHLWKKLCGLWMWSRRTNHRPCCPRKSTPWASQWTARPDGYEWWDNRMTGQHLPRDRVRPSSCLKNWHKRRRRCHADALINKRKWRHILFICFVCLFPDTKFHSSSTHSLHNSKRCKQTKQNFVQRHLRRRNHRVTDTFSAECFATALEAEPQDCRHIFDTIVR